MKFLKLCLLFIIAATLTFCSDDQPIPDDMSETEEEMTDGDTTEDTESANQESTILEANLVSDGLVVEGATKIESALPQPNGAISFTIASNGSAIINEGFDIQFASAPDLNIAGAYLQITTTDGSAADAYYDIPSGSFNSFGDREVTLNKAAKARLMDVDQTIDIGFDTTIPAGQFCYTLCVYDDLGNISLPEEVCLTVENFGGNANLVGVWNMTTYQETYDGMTISAGLGETFCFDDQLLCNNGDFVAITECSSYELLRFTINADGSYSLEEEIIDSDIDYDQTVSSCMEIERPDTTYGYVSSGKWAYNQTQERIVFIEYSFTENDNGEIYSETFPLGEGEVLLDALVVITSNSFTISESYGDGDTYSITFEN